MHSLSSTVVILQHYMLLLCGETKSHLLDAPSKVLLIDEGALQMFLKAA